MQTTYFFRARAAGMLLMLGFVASGTLYAQGSTASVLGTVTDSSGAVIPNASVQVKNVGTGQTQQASADAQGRYTVADLPIGNYEAQASAQGFQTVVRRGITLTVGAQSVVDFSLAVGQAQQTVTVEATVSQVDTVSTAVASYVEQKQINDLPLNGRNFTDLVALAPGVSTGSQIGNGGANLLYGVENNFSVSGARSEGQAYLLDNTDVQGFWNHGSGSGVMGTTLGIEAIAEFSLLTNTYSAQFGGNGAVVNSASKSGTNTLHGSAYEFLRNSALDARNFFDGSKVPPFRQNQFGGSLGGPIKKDKLFFFVNDEELRRALGQTFVAFVPDANAHNGIVNGVNVPINPRIAPILALYPIPATSVNGVGQIPEVDTQTGNENYLLARVDYTLSSKDSLFVRYVRDYGDIVNPFLGSPLPPRWPEVGQTRNQFVTIEERRVISPTLVNLLRFSFTRTRETDVQAKPDQTPALDFFPERGQNGGVNITGLSSIGTSIFAPLLEVQNKFPLADDVFWTHGAHSLRFGALFSRVQSNFQQQGWWGGFYTFPSLTAFLQGTPSLFQGPEPGLTDSYRDFREVEVDGYIHDEWKALPTLTVNIGLRYEFVTNPTTNVHPLNAIVNPPFGTYQRVPNVFASNPSLHNFDPRIGLAYDPFGDHKTAIRAGFGIFYDPIRARSYASGYYFNPPYALAFVPNPAFPDPFPGALPPPAQLVGVDYNTVNTPRMYQWNFNVQRQLFESTTLTVGYVGSRGLHLYAARDINPVLPTVVNGVQVFGVPRGATPGMVGNPRLNPAAAALSSEAPVGDSSYNSLQVGLNRRFSHGVQGQLSYTWSKCMDDASGTYGLEGGIPWSDPLNGSFDRGRCLFDRPQVFRLSGVYTLPFTKNILVKGWQMSGNLLAQSGPPWNVILGTGFDQSGSAVANQRPNLILPADQVITGNVNQWVNPAGFSLPAPGTLGNLQRDFLWGPGIVNFDYSVVKDTPIKEQVHLQFRAEFFNLFNHPNFGLPNANAFVQTANGGGNPNPTFGKITTTTTSSRQIQFALKLMF
ncbi:MAG TPA: carboxypeptidase regulatory-like domain-containing protein [Bryobacteraceae bacterium]|nr:carboxypeptidase regulatory-like domain-containing protein [Bryobacteraceae bacterium]